MKVRTLVLFPLVFAGIGRALAQAPSSIAGYLWHTQSYYVGVSLYWTAIERFQPDGTLQTVAQTGGGSAAGQFYRWQGGSQAYQYTKLSDTQAELKFTNGTSTYTEELQFDSPTALSGDAYVGPTKMYRFVLVSPDVTPTLTAVSCRVNISPGETNTFGFVVQKASPWVLVRAVGPGLAKFGVANPLQHPTFAVYKGTSVVDSDTEWSNPSIRTTSIQRATEVAGAFPLDAGSTDSATVFLASPGAYTVQVGSASASDTGDVLIEVYQLP